MKQYSGLKPAYTLALSRTAKRDLDHLPERDSKRVYGGLAHIQSNPLLGKKLSGKFSKLYSYRVWPYRIIYQPIKKILLVFVIRIGHRQGIYR